MVWRKYLQCMQANLIHVLQQITIAKNKNKTYQESLHLGLHCSFTHGANYILAEGNNNFSILSRYLFLKYCLELKKWELKIFTLKENIIFQLTFSCNDTCEILYQPSSRGISHFLVECPTFSSLRVEVLNSYYLYSDQRPSPSHSTFYNLFIYLLTISRLKIKHINLIQLSTQYPKAKTENSKR